MDNQDKLFKQFQEASNKAETKDFPAMEKVWSKVEQKLDKKEDKKTIVLWKKLAVAASLLLFFTIGYQIFDGTKSDVPSVSRPQNNVVVEDDKNDSLQAKPEKAAATDGKERKPSDVMLPKAASKNTGIANSPKTNQKPAASVQRMVNEPSASQAGDNAVASNNPGAVIHGKSPVEKKITGTVIGTDGLPLPMVTVTIKGTNKTVQSDFDGNYQIVAKTGDQLVYNFMGTKPQTAIVSDNNRLDITLEENMLDEVVINTGYNTVARKKMTSAIASVSVQEIGKRAKSRKGKIRDGDKQSANNGTTTWAAGTVSGGGNNAGYVVVDDIANDFNYYRGNVYNKSNSQPDSDTDGVPDAVDTEPNSKPGVAVRTNAGTYDIDYNGVPDELQTSQYEKLPNGRIVARNVPGQIPSTPIEDRANSNAIQNLQGQIAGVNISTGSGTPGGMPEIVLRGIGSINGMAQPLIVVDGVPMENALQQLDSNDIENFKILKDVAATALYGSRGSNGVIIITTKAGAGKLSRKEAREFKRKLRKGAKGKLSERPEHTFPEKGTISVSGDSYEAFEENKFENPISEPLSTFSIDVDHASYTNIRRFLNNGQSVPKDAVRIEEMMNFFKYEYPQPKDKHPFSINTEYSDCPWNKEHKLVRIGLQGKIIPQNSLPPSNLVFLIDVSGSMNEPNKLPLLVESMKILVNELRENDKVAIVVYAGAAGMVLPPTSGDKKADIFAALNKLSAGGSTAGGAGIELAYKLAREHFVKNGNNRVILATDGDFNVGASSNTDMRTLIEEQRKSGVFLTCLGYGMGNYKDDKLQILADKGNGNHAYIDNIQEANRFLGKEFKGSMFTIAKDVKIQIEFNPKHVQAYRLIGYETRKLRTEDFADDAIDAGELGSGHTVTALYEIVPEGVKSDYFTAQPALKYTQTASTSGNYNDELATVKFRYKKPDGDTSTEMIQIIENKAVPLKNASGDFKFCTAVAWFGLKLRDSKLVSEKSTADIVKMARQGLSNDPDGYRAEFIRLAETVK